VKAPLAISHLDRGAFAFSKADQETGISQYHFRRIISATQNSPNNKRTQALLMVADSTLVALDRNRDGRVNIEDFKQVIKRKTENKPNS